jgi:hypothetical protein
MKNRLASVLLLILCFLSVPPAIAQQIDYAANGLKSMAVPQTEHICTLDPTDINAHFYLEADQEIQKQFKTAATAIFEVDYKINESSCGSSAWPPQTLQAFQHAMDIWSVHLNSPIPIKIEAFWTELEERTLGSAGPTRIVQLPNVGEPDTWYTISQLSAMSGRILREEIELDNGEPLGYDIRINMNCSFANWYFGTDANPPENTIDFTTVVLHEIGHGIGFFGSMSVPEGSTVGEWGTGSSTLPFIYDRFAVDGDDSFLLNESVYPNPSTQLFDALTGRRGGVFFDGVSALATLDDSPVPKAKLYTPEEFSQGSSYSHVDQETFTMTPNALMRPRIDRALAIHSPGPLFCGILNDMEWPLGAGCLSFLAADAIVSVEPDDIDFGVINSDETKQFTFEISNDASATVDLTGNISINGDNFSLQDEETFNIQPGNSISVNLLYEPDEEDIDVAIMEIFHNARNIASPIRVDVTAEALRAGRLVKLEQSYPNPTVGSGASLQIPFAISENSNVSLEIYTADGRLVNTIIDGEIRDAMRYEELVTMNGLASGVYFYRLIVDGEVETGKFMHVQ